MREEWSKASSGDARCLRIDMPAADRRDLPARGGAATAGGPARPLVPSDDDPLTTLPSEFDAVEEVDAVARSLRRAALEYAALLLALLLAPPLLARVAPPWFTRPVWGGITPNFFVVAVLLYAAFLAIAAVYTRFAEHVEDEMLGRREVEEALDA